MKKLIPFIILSMVLTMAVSAEWAAHNPAGSTPPEQGTFSFTVPLLRLNGLVFFGDASNASFGESGNIFLSTTATNWQLGYFVAQGIEVGPLFTIFNPMSASENEEINIGAFVNFYLPADGVMPFFGAQAQLMDVTAADNYTSIRLRGGAAFLPAGLRLAPYAAAEVVVSFSNGSTAGNMNLVAGLKTFF